MERFFGMEIKGDGIVIRPLESVTQFYKEGKAMPRCYHNTETKLGNIPAVDNEYCILKCR